MDFSGLPLLSKGTLPSDPTVLTEHQPHHRLPRSLPPAAHPLRHLFASTAAEGGLLAARPKQTLTASVTTEKCFFQDITNCHFPQLFRHTFATVSLGTSTAPWFSGTRSSADAPSRLCWRTHAAPAPTNTINNAEPQVFAIKWLISV